MDAGEQVSLERGLGEMRGLTSGIRIALDDLKTDTKASNSRLEKTLVDHTIDDKSMFHEIQAWMQKADERRAADSEGVLEIARRVALEALEHARLEALEVVERARVEKGREHWATIRTVAIAVLSAGLGIVGTVIKSYLEHPS